VFKTHLLAKHMNKIYPSLYLDTQLIFNIGYRVRAKVFGQADSDMAHLLQLQKARQAQGDTFDLHFTPEGGLKCVFFTWINQTKISLFSETLFGSGPTLTC
jgi:hypothetical protein